MSSNIRREVYDYLGNTIAFPLSLSVFDPKVKRLAADLDVTKVPEDAPKVFPALKILKQIKPDVQIVELPSGLECIAKATPLAKGATLQESVKASFENSNTLRGGLVEVLAWALTQPEMFIAHTFVERDRNFYVVIFLAKLRRTLSALLGEFSHSVQKALSGQTLDLRGAENTYDFANVCAPFDLLATLGQLFLVTLPRLGTYRLCHHDLKCDNMMYAKTPLEYLYVRRSNGQGHAEEQVIAIPTRGRLFYAIDFGWASFSVEGQLIRSSEPNRCAETMKRGDPRTNQYQLACSVHRHLGDLLKNPQLTEGWRVIRRLLKSTHGLVPENLIMAEDSDSWFLAFYAFASNEDMRKAPESLDLFDFFLEFFAQDPTDVPLGSDVVNYQS
jgi:hypothetical protein